MPSSVELTYQDIGFCQLKERIHEFDKMYKLVKVLTPN